MPEGLDPRDLFKEWLHSHEEDAAGTQVYRPGSFKFPPARGRSGFDLRHGGQLEQVAPGPSDRPEAVRGSWSLNGRTLEITAGGACRQFEIVSVEPDKLVVRKPPSVCRP